MASSLHLIWKRQRDTARRIKEVFGVAKALGYLIGEKLVTYVRASSTRPLFASELPRFVAEIRSIFTADEIRGYLDNVKRIGALGHVCTDEEHEFLREHGAVEDDPVAAAEDILIMERIREMLLGDDDT